METHSCEYLHEFALHVQSLVGAHTIRKAGISQVERPRKPCGRFSMYQEDLLWLSRSSRETDFPVRTLPQNVIPCGPIFLSLAPASEQDPELVLWLEGAPTILNNVGSYANYDEFQATEMARAVEVLLDNSSVQVLWKFNKWTEFSNNFLSDLSKRE
jgi:hypothetical protein